MNAECYIVVWTRHLFDSMNRQYHREGVEIHDGLVTAFHTYKELKVQEAIEDDTSISDVVMYCANKWDVTLEYADRVRAGIDAALKAKSEKEMRRMEAAAKAKERKEREEYERLKAKFEKPQFPECVDQEA